jgi:DNA-3-methyladenine glycosylase
MIRANPCESVARLLRKDYAGDARRVARALLGRRLVRVLEDGSRVSGVIVETEAYLGEPDRASHAYGLRRTARNEAMYAQPGTSYVYFTYGMHHCMNVVCGAVDVPHAVLIRALEPMEGLEAMRQLRAGGNGRLRGPRDTGLCSGPAKLCEALGIDRGLNFVDLVTDERLFVEGHGPGENEIPDDMVVNTVRVGVDYAGKWARKKLRWYVRDNPHVSVRDTLRRSSRRNRASPAAGARRGG